MTERDIIAENQTAAAISKLRRGEADDSLRDEVQAATLTTMQRMLDELADLKSGLWTKSGLKSLISEEQASHCDHCPTRRWVDAEIARSKAKPAKCGWLSEIVRSESLRYFILVAILVYALIYAKTGIEGVRAAREGLVGTMTGEAR